MRFLMVISSRTTTRISREIGREVEHMCRRWITILGRERVGRSLLGNANFDSFQDVMLHL